MSDKTSKQKWLNTLQFFAGYLVAAWTFLQFVDWILNRYNISPNWVDLLLWTFIGIIPSLLIYLYHRDRINEGKIKLKEKIFVPLNIAILSLVIYIGFGNSDLGATTKNISFENEEGLLETKTITKEEFRIGVPIFGFEQVNKNDSINSWLRYGIGKILYQDLLQNKNITPEFSFYTSTTTKIREASLFYDLYVDGDFVKTEEEYTINVSIRKANNAKTKSRQSFSGKNLLRLLDDISIYITSEVNKDSKNNLEYVDLPIEEFMSNSYAAIRAFANSDYDKAYTIDPYFALAYLEEAKLNRRYNRGQLETQDIINKASKYKTKLPLQKQLEVLIQQNLALGNYQEAEKQIKLQLEVDPNNSFYNSVLFSIFGETRNLEEYFKVSRALFDNNPSSISGNNLAIAAMVAGYDKDLIEAISAFEIINPEVRCIKIEPLIFLGEIEKSKSVFEEFKQSHSFNTNRNQVYDSIFKYLSKDNLNSNNIEAFTGLYRSNLNEQTLDYWVENDRLIEYSKNQIMRAYIPAGIDAYGGGLLQNETYYGKLVRDSIGKIIALKKSDNDWKSTYTRLFWRIDSTIIKANDAFDKGSIIEAENLYKIAFEKNPNHSYLENILGHINYTKNNDSIALQNQYDLHTGDYGPRKFWVENGKFYYKRKGADVNLPKVELLPISESIYMDLTRLGTIMGFEKSNNAILSTAYTFNDDTFEYEKNKNGDNTFKKSNE